MELLQSRTFWTNIIGIIATLVVNFGVNISPEQQVDIITGIMSITGILSVYFKKNPRPE